MEPPVVFSSLQLRQSLLLEGKPTGWEAVQELCGTGASPAEQEELQQLLHVWYTDWHCFPPWKHVLRARTIMLEPPEPEMKPPKSKSGTEQPPPPPPAPVEWSDLSYPEKRMVVELPLAKHARKTATELVRRARQRRDEAQQRAPQAAAGQQEREELPPQAADTQPAAAGAAADASSDLFLAGPAVLLAFLEFHCLGQAGQEGRGPAGRYNGIMPLSHKNYDTCKPGFAGLDAVCGRTHNLTVRQVEQLIIRLALAASGGMSYAEAYGWTWKPRDKAAAKQVCYLPCPPDMEFCDLLWTAKSATAFSTTSAGKRGQGMTWIDLFCRPPSAAPQPTPAAAAEAATAGSSSSAGPTAAAASCDAAVAAPPPAPPLLPPPHVLQHCEHVALLADTAWPWQPLQPPPSLTDAGCVRQLRAAVAAGLKPLLLARAYADL
ncbi:hypothetical protein HXX76_003117 [Chlamydomonas incerta]|uniref:Uncharacterized protein n=1 Tax=Chlamydomonas incerta TaxID=51695 RepID=A0A835TMA3_CHLIN|nr:hypothetical protein HXX76_003117 [Chlamydomonas incerta]|eukprot:KAG2441495.1 hypothetical protein HXX76_003117 [Chlamydomonas incerta]